MSDNMPDFDNMTQDEITAWLETLAKRQGASEGFTTAADMDIAEVDPDTVVIDEPGYIPYGQETAAQSRPSPEPTPVQPIAAAQPPEAPPPVQPVQPIAAPEPAYTPPAAELPPLDIPEVQPQSEPVAPVEQGGLAWLASLAADQDEEIFNLDLSDLPANTAEPVAPPAVVNPMTWLEDLARAQVAEPSLERLGADDDDEEESEKLNPYTQNADPMEWLETLAKRQGADPEELTTGARMKIPSADEAEVEEPGYEPFSFDTPPSRRAAEPVDTANWLSSLAGAEGYSESGVLATQPQEEPPAETPSMAEIQDAINAGTVTSDQMQQFLDQQAEQLAAAPDEAYELVDDGMPLAPAELPDWLSDLKPEPTATTTAEPTKPLDALFETPAVPEMPDWLRQDMIGDEALTLASIFETDEESSQPFVAISDDAGLGYEVEVDASDPWVEAFDLEYEQGGAADTESVPAWYEQNLNDPARIAAVDGQSVDVLPPMDEPIAAETPIPVEDVPAAPQVTLEEAALPTENDLPAGQPQEVPAWAGAVDIGDLYSAADDQYDEQFVEEAAAFEESEDYGEIEIPDWLKEVETAVSPDDVPAWLVQTIAGDTVEAEIEPEPEPAPPPVVVQPPPAAPPTPTYAPPAAQAAAATSAEAAEVLNRARDKEQSGDLEGALAEYEAMVRGSVDLDAVVADLTQLTKSYKTTPAVFRVLGDGLMRQGKLQAALNTYREALNQL